MKALVIIGSLRSESFNKTLANSIIDCLSEHGVETEILEYSHIPFFNQDAEFPTPKEITKIRQQFKSADFVWIVTPEYNGSVPGVLKNLLDWVSRPDDQSTRKLPEYIAGKQVAVSGVAGKSAASRVITEITGLLGRIGLQPLESTLGLSLPVTAFKTGEYTPSGEDLGKIRQQVLDVLESLKYVN